MNNNLHDGVPLLSNKLPNDIEGALSQDSHYGTLELDRAVSVPISNRQQYASIFTMIFKVLSLLTLVTCVLSLISKHYDIDPEAQLLGSEGNYQMRRINSIVHPL